MPRIVINRDRRMPRYGEPLLRHSMYLTTSMVEELEEVSAILNKRYKTYINKSQLMRLGLDSVLEMRPEDIIAGLKDIGELKDSL